MVQTPLFWDTRSLFFGVCLWQIFQELFLIFGWIFDENIWSFFDDFSMLACENDENWWKYLMIFWNLKKFLMKFWKSSFLMKFWKSSFLMKFWKSSKMKIIIFDDFHENHLKMIFWWFLMKIFDHFWWSWKYLMIFDENIWSFLMISPC